MSLSPEIKKALTDELWHRGDLEYKLHAAQRVIYRLVRTLPRDQREALLFCARRFGKSFLGVILALEDCLRNPGVQVAIIGPKHKQTLKIVKFNLRKIMKDMPEGLIRPSKSTSTWIFANESVLTLGGFDTILESERGADYFSIYIEETGLATADLEEYVYLLYSVLFPTMMHSRGRLHHLTTPSRIIDHPLHLETLPKCRMSDAFYLFTIEQNPLLTAEDIEKEIELLGGRGSVGVERELFCKIVRDESITIVPQFDETRHVASLARSDHYKYLVSGDFGYKADKSAFHLMAYDHNVGKVVVLEEFWCEALKSTPEVAAALKEKWGDLNPTYVIDYQGNTGTDLSREGVPPVFPFKDKFDPTITFIRNEFYLDKLLIDPSCALLIQTLRSGTFNKQKTDFLRTVSLGHADALMSLIYGLRHVDKVTDLRPRPDPTQVWVPPHLRNPQHQQLRKLFSHG